MGVAVVTRSLCEFWVSRPVFGISEARHFKSYLQIARRNLMLMRDRIPQYGARDHVTY